MNRLTPDPALWILKASRAAERVARMSNDLGALVSEIEDNLRNCQQQGLTAEKLDYCVRRVQEIRYTLNGLELGSFTGISVKNTCDELWRKMP